MGSDIRTIGTFVRQPNEIPKNEPMRHSDFGATNVSLKFSSVEEANAWRPQDVNPSHDPTVPATMEQKKQIVVELMEAMKRIDLAEDNEGMIKPFREQKHNPVRIEIVCWNILVGCVILEVRLLNTNYIR